MVQDLAKTLELTRDLPPGVELIAHDVFTPQPIIHAKAYFMRWILHDYVDSHARVILHHIADAMASNTCSVPLICEAVLSERLDQGTLVAGVIDLVVMACAGKDRTRKGFESLLGKVGLRIDRFWERVGTAGSVIEAVRI